MIKNTPNAYAKYLAVQNLSTPSLDDVPHVLDALQQNSKKPTDSPLRVKEGDNGFLFLSSHLVDKDQSPSARKACITGKDRNTAHDFLHNMCAAISGDLSNSPEVANTADALALHIHAAQPRNGAQRSVDDTQVLRNKLIALNQARQEQNRTRKWDARQENWTATQEAFRRPLPPDIPGIPLEDHIPDLPSVSGEGVTALGRHRQRRKSFSAAVEATPPRSPIRP